MSIGLLQVLIVGLLVEGNCNAIATLPASYGSFQPLTVNTHPQFKPFIIRCLKFGAKLVKLVRLLVLGRKQELGQSNATVKRSVFVHFGKTSLQQKSNHPQNIPASQRLSKTRTKKGKKKEKVMASRLLLKVLSKRHPLCSTVASSSRFVIFLLPFIFFIFEN